MDKNLKLVALDIIAMAKKDQDLRKAKTWNQYEVDKWDKVHKDKIIRFVNKYGLITISKFGKRASRAAWLLIQHFTPNDISFMEKYLNMMEINSNDIDIRNIAYLSDRICLYKNVPQTYGTQTVVKAGNRAFHTIKDPVNIDTLRVSKNLDTLSNYAKVFAKKGFQLKLPKDYKILK